MVTIQQTLANPEKLGGDVIRIKRQSGLVKRKVAIKDKKKSNTNK
jgi:hypothetical protein